MNPTGSTESLKADPFLPLHLSSLSPFFLGIRQTWFLARIRLPDKVLARKWCLDRFVVCLPIPVQEKKRSSPVKGAFGRCPSWECFGSHSLTGVLGSRIVPNGKESVTAS